MAVTDPYELIRGAILGREQGVATYSGHERGMCPHAIGTKNGRHQVLFFPFAAGGGAACASTAFPTWSAVREGGTPPWTTAPPARASTRWTSRLAVSGWPTP